MRLRRPALGTVLGATALAVALTSSGGVAEAAKLINGKFIKAGTVTSKQIKDGSVAPADLSAAAKVAGPQGVVGPAGPAGTAVASGAVSSVGTLSHYHGVAGTTVYRNMAGLYCVTVPGVSSATSTMVVSVYALDPASAFGDGGTTGANTGWCPAGTFGVWTFNKDGALKDAGFTFAVN